MHLGHCTETPRPSRELKTRELSGKPRPGSRTRAPTAGGAATLPPPDVPRGSARARTAFSRAPVRTGSSRGFTAAPGGQPAPRQQRRGPAPTLGPAAGALRPPSSAARAGPGCAPQQREAPRRLSHTGAADFTCRVLRQLAAGPASLPPPPPALGERSRTARRRTRAPACNTCPWRGACGLHAAPRTGSGSFQSRTRAAEPGRENRRTRLRARPGLSPARTPVLEAAGERSRASPARRQPPPGRAALPRGTRGTSYGLRGAGCRWLRPRP